MPKVALYRGAYRDENNRPVEIKEDIVVDSEGVFGCPVPEALLELAERLIYQNAPGWAGVYITGRQGSRKFLRTSASLKNLTQALDDLLRVYSVPEIKEDLIIRYYIAGRVAIWREPDGRLYPNGGAVPGGCTSGNRWVTMRKQYHAMEKAPSFGVDVGAQVVSRITKTRGSFVKVEYAVPSPEVRAAWLNRGAPFAPGDRLSGFILNLWAPDPRDVVEIPYTTEAELFFYDALMKVAAIAVEFEEFGAAPERVQLAIEGTGPGLLGMEVR